jgi:hypothetical protein
MYEALNTLFRGSSQAISNNSPNRGDNLRDLIGTSVNRFARS